MNYPQSHEILEEIRKAKKILINLHRGPDPDSFGSAMSLYSFLCSLKKQVDVVVTSTTQISGELLAFPESRLIKSVDFSKFDFKKYDLFICADSGSWQQIVDNDEVKIPEIPIVVIDHHVSNEKFGQINLIEANASSCAEVVYKVFEDWKFEIDKQIANLLLTGIIGDTGGFQFSNNSETLKIAAELIEKGANKSRIIEILFRTKSFEQVKIWGEFLVRLEIDKEHKFVWTALPFGIYQKYGNPPKANSHVATMFLSIIDKTNFGIVMIEKEKGVVDISFRSRNNFDVSKLGEELGGGGHRGAAGGKVTALSFEKAVEKVLATARRYAKT